mmetsp:Transcript_6813/g.9938  ORF Transcript_6813/g.9938 Transcript_6813/m.9938 type:complete len:132 (-) Transcript_6813:1187-1582(-)
MKKQPTSHAEYNLKWHSKQQTRHNYCPGNPRKVVTHGPKHLQSTKKDKNVAPITKFSRAKNQPKPEVFCLGGAFYGKRRALEPSTISSNESVSSKKPKESNINNGTFSRKGAFVTDDVILKRVQRMNHKQK